MTTERAPLLVDARQFVKPEAGRPEPDAGSGRNIVEVRGLNVWYGAFQALNDISFAVPENRITAIIGPSGCGKSTILRCINRMNDLLTGFRAEGEVIFEGEDVYASGLDPADVRRRTGRRCRNIILVDEPCSALDPVATLKIEDLMRDLARNYTIVIVTHNMQQAARVSDYTMMMMMDENRSGVLDAHGPTRELFTNPKDKRTEDYITGRVGWGP